MRTLTIGTRRSKLALVQTEWVRAALLAAHADLEIAVEHIVTRGDVILDRPLSKIGDKGLFVTEIEDALRAGRIDLAVHSAKDLPSVLPADMALAAFPRRADARDVLVSRSGATLDALPVGARVGTSSPRRICQLRQLRPDLEILDIRGNVDTRLRKLDDGGYDALVLAAAGLERLQLAGRITERLAPEQFTPAVSQGTLGIEIRAGDAATALLLAALDDPEARTTALAEKAVLARIGGGCQVAVGAYATLDNATLTLAAMAGALDGRLIRATRSGPASDPVALGTAVADTLLAAGAQALLAAVE